MGIWTSPEKRTDKKDAPLFKRDQLTPLIPQIEQYIQDYNDSNKCIRISYGLIFGSYAAGADMCHDLDVAFIVEELPEKATSFNETELAELAIQEDLHCISKQIEVHFVDSNHCMSVNWAMLVHGHMIGPEKDLDSSQSYIFTGPYQMIYSYDRKKAFRIQINLLSHVITHKSYITGIFNVRVLDFLCCYSYLGYVYCDEKNQHITSVQVRDIMRLGGMNLACFGIEDSDLKEALNSALLAFNSINTAEANETQSDS